MSRHAIEGHELTEQWRTRVTEAIGAAEGLRDYSHQFIKEASQILNDWGNPYPLGAEMAHFSDYRQTVNQIIGHLEDAMKIYREYVEIFGGDVNFVRCDCCDLFKPDCEDYPSPDKQDIMFLCGDCRKGL